MTTKLTTLSWTLIFTCFYFGQPVSRVLSNSRKMELVKIRQIVQYLMYHSGMTYEQAGDLTGTGWEAVRSNVRRVKGLIEAINGKVPDKVLKQDIEQLTAILN